MPAVTLDSMTQPASDATAKLDTRAQVLRSAALSVLGRQWRAGGGQTATRGAAEAIVDPEALVLLSLALAGDEPRLADEVRRLRHHGLEPGPELELARPGFNYRLTDILCAVGIPQLERLDQLLAERTRIAAAYTERLRDRVETPSADEGDVHGWQAYVIQVDGAADKISRLRAHGIEAQVGTYALHRLAAYRDQGDFPGAARVFDRAIALPFHTRLTDSELDRVAGALTALL